MHFFFAHNFACIFNGTDYWKRHHSSYIQMYTWQSIRKKKSINDNLRSRISEIQGYASDLLALLNSPRCFSSQPMPWGSRWTWAMLHGEYVHLERPRPLGRALPDMIDRVLIVRPAGYPYGPTPVLLINSSDQFLMQRRKSLVPRWIREEDFLQQLDEICKLLAQYPCVGSEKKNYKTCLNRILYYY